MKIQRANKRSGIAALAFILLLVACLIVAGLLAALIAEALVHAFDAIKRALGTRDNDKDAITITAPPVTPMDIVYVEFPAWSTNLTEWHVVTNWPDASFPTNAPQMFFRKYWP